jgi:hypothetical protein
MQQGPSIQARVTIREIIRAEIVGTRRCTTARHTGTGNTPVFDLCRRLLAAGYDPKMPLHAYRDATLALIVRSISEGASLTVRDDQLGCPRFRPWTPPDVARASLAQDSEEEGERLPQAGFRAPRARITPAGMAWHGT